MTYDDLTAAIAAWLNRPEAEPSIPTFIALAEAQMNRDLAENGIVGAIATDTPLSLMDEFVPAPSDLASPVSLRLATGEAVENLSWQGFEDRRQRLDSATGQPLYFTVAGAASATCQLRLLPTPDKAYAALLTYAQRLESLSDANPTNWLLTQYPDAYLYGALAQSAPFLGDDARLATWSGLYATGMAGILKAERAKRGAQANVAYRPDIPHRHPHSHFR